MADVNLFPSAQSWQRFARPLRLIIVGGLATVCYLLLAIGFLKIGGLTAPVASLLAHGLAGVFSYFGHRAITFRVTGKHGQAPLRFIALNGFSYCIALIAPWIAGALFGLPDTGALLFTAVLLPIINALMMANFIFQAPILDQTVTAGARLQSEMAQNGAK